MLSFNVRGLGGILKRREIKDLVRKERVDFVCIQETKKDSVDRRLVESIWGNENVDWVFTGANGLSGGLLSMWDRDVFEKEVLWG